MRAVRGLAAPLKAIYRRHLDQVYTLFEPIDYLARFVNGKRDYPPLRLRAFVGPLRTFESSCAEVLGYLGATCGLAASSRVLDIGCGCGALALQLRGRLDGRGRYVGLDVHRPSIAWAQRHLADADGQFQFVCMDVRNPQYNPSGRHSGASYVFPFPDGSFDVIVAKSVFTHLRPDEVANYLRQVARLLSAGGHCFATFFLLSPQREALARRGQSPRFEHGEGVWRCADPALPERAIAYSEEHVRSLLLTNGLELARPIAYGHQDALLIRRR